MGMTSRNKTSDMSTEELLALAERKLRGAERVGTRGRKSGTAATITAMNAAGVVEGYASTWDREPDSYGDIVAKGAFAETLAEWRQRSQPIPLLYGHRTDSPKYNIGRVVDAYEDERGLFIRAEFDADNETAQQVRKLAQQGRLFQFSFAYQTLDQGSVTLPGGIRANELRKLKLFEVSLVQVPANQHAVVTSVKSGEPGSNASLTAELAKARRLIAVLKEAIQTLTRL